MKVVFRVDASTRIGAGHLMRCLSLAEALNEKNIQTSFICREHRGNLIAFMREKAFSVIALPAPKYHDMIFNDDYEALLGVRQIEDAMQTIMALNGEGPDWLVVDHYALDANWEKMLRQFSNGLMVIDDLANRLHDCDVLLDQNYSVDGENRYRSLVPEFCQIFLGPQFALLGKDFRILRQQKIAKPNQLKKLLIFFTSGNDQGETLKAMQGVALFGKAEQVDVVVGKENPDIVLIQEMCALRGWGYHCQIDYMAKLIANADLAIGAGGSSNWERCALGVPALVVVLAENQASIAHALNSANVVVNLGWNTKLAAQDYANAINGISIKLLKMMSKNAFQMVDGMGAERIINILSNDKIQLNKIKSLA